ncbi:MAG: TonB-dependent receptor [Alphaproteobacteria bacterium]
MKRGIPLVVGASALMAVPEAFAQGAGANPAGATSLPPIVVQAQKKPKRTAARRTPAAVIAAPRTDAPRTTLTVTPASAGLIAGPAPVKQKYQLPQTSEGITAQKIEQTINVVDTADAVKYLPSLFVRKRNDGDNQAVLATRNWGLSSSARTLIYADDVLLSTLLGNNNGNASPRWGMVAPEEIQRIDFLYGPFAAMYPGNSIGGVLQITTRMPDKPEFTFKQTEAFQTFDFYKTSNTYRTDQTSASFGNRWGGLSVFLSANVQSSNSQPLNWITAGNGVFNNFAGAVAQLNRVYQPANVIGAGGLLHTEQANVKGKFVFDLTDWLKATYVIGFFDNDQQSRVQSYLTDGKGNPTYGGVANGAGFATAYYNLAQQQLANAFTLKTDTRGALDGELVVTRFDYLTDIQRNPFTVLPTGLGFTDVGRITRLDGTNWTTVDAKGIWRTAAAGPHEVSFGVHGDRYELVNPIYKTPNWQDTSIDATPELYTNSLGKTQTVGLWAQDAWRFAPQWKLTLGGRWEEWRAFDGFTLNTLTDATTGAITATRPVVQPSLEAARFSPKASLAWEPSKEWQVTASVGVANRFPTVTELYQTVIVAGQISLPNPNLRPEEALATELAIERKFSDGKVRLSLFEDHTRDALIAQNTTFVDPGTGQTVTTSIVTNIESIRARGAELAWQKDNVGIEHLELFGSITYVDARIVSDPTFVPTAGIPPSTAVGRRVPNVPEWRTTLGATYRPTDQWAFTLVGRWQSKTFATLDNIDTNPNVYQAFDPFVVVDTRIQYKVSQNGTLAFGIDNIFNEKYHLFHAFPQRTFVLSGKATF